MGPAAPYAQSFWGPRINKKALLPEPFFIDEQATRSDLPRRPTIKDVRDDNVRSVRLSQPAGRRLHQRHLCCLAQTSFNR
jgi:hypothetical protein